MSLSTLNRDVIQSIAGHLTYNDVLSLCRVTKPIYQQLCSSHDFWFNLVEQNLTHNADVLSKLRKLDTATLRRLYLNTMYNISHFHSSNNEQQEDFILQLLQAGFELPLYKLYNTSNIADLSDDILDIAIKNNRTDIINWLLHTIGYNDYDKLLFYGAKYNRSDLISLALQHNADIHQGLRGAAIGNQKHLVDEYLNDLKDTTNITDVLNDVAYEGQLDMLRYLINTYIHGDFNPDDVIVHAVMGGDLNMIKTLVEYGAHIPNHIITEVLNRNIGIEDTDTLDYILSQLTIPLTNEEIKKYIVDWSSHKLYKLIPVLVKYWHTHLSKWQYHVPLYDDWTYPIYQSIISGNTTQLYQVLSQIQLLTSKDIMIKEINNLILIAAYTQHYNMIELLNNYKKWLKRQHF